MVRMLVKGEEEWGMEGELASHIHSEMVSPTKTGIGPHEDLIKLLRVSYDHLDGNVQRCFLFSTLFCDSQDINVDHLIQCWKGEGLL
ncbi:hypothetical protein QJS10_CPB04g01809 [Acorus calamus]|uniref:Uncharacterized protein n=1 Tax=Acorus calamus TaxID=4465 RepID=A0AAV9EZ31_ACOCL|nr:hypothetical protein QJS10_CPB04g01809 [Acorus calamus]